MREKESYNVKDISLTTDIVSQIPTVSMLENEFQIFLSNFMTIQWLRSPGSFFYWFGCIRKKEKAQCEGNFFTSDVNLQIPTVEICKNEFRTWFPNFTVIQRLTNSGSSFYWDKFKCMLKKERILGGKKKTNLRERENVESLKADLICLYL